jgi:hypothetical protein
MVSRFAPLGHVALFVCLLTAMTFSTAPAAAAQTARPGTLQVTVVDQSGAVIGNATVTVEGAEAATKGQTPAPVQTNAQGIANLAGLPPGRYSVRAEFPGFETRALPEVRVRAGDNKQVMMLPIAGVQDSVTVERNKQETAADRQSTFGTVLTREQLEALSDDPDILRQQRCRFMAGPSAVIKVDSFEGARAAAQGDDPLHPDLARSVRGREPLGRWHVGGDHHAAGPGSDPLQRRLPLPRRTAERAQPVHADARAGADQELSDQPERHAGAAEGVVQLQRRRAQLVRDAEYQRVHRSGTAIGSGAAPPRATTCG